MGFDVLPLVLPPLCEGPNADAARHHEERHVVDLAWGEIPHVIGETQPFSRFLAWEGESGNLSPRVGPRGVIDDQVVPFAVCREKPIEAVGPHGPLPTRTVRCHFLFKGLDDLLPFESLWVTVPQEPLHAPPQPQVLPEEHLKIQVGIDVLEVDVAQHMHIQIRRNGNRYSVGDRRADPGHGRPRLLGKCPLFL